MKPRTQFWLRAVIGVLVLFTLVFLSSGRLEYWQGWVYIGLSLAVLFVTARVLRDNPELVSERLHPGKGMKAWDKVYFLASTPLYFIAIIVAGIDSRHVHSARQFPPVLYAVGISAFVLGQAIFLWAKKANPYFSSVVRIQTERGQTVCRGGPYRFVRHPGYLAGIVFGLATPLVLGSLSALIPQGLAAAMLVARTALEDRMLLAELLWYPEYARAVNFRLIPGLW